MAKLRCAWVSGMLQMVMSSVKPAVLIITLPGTLSLVLPLDRGSSMIRANMRCSTYLFRSYSEAYNGNAAGYRHILFERLVILAKGEKGCRIDSGNP